jgi:hypothetical protein
MQPLAAPALAILAIACSYAPPSSLGDDDGPAIDAPTTEDDARTVDAGVDAPPPQVTCTTSDSSLRACYEFEDPVLGMALDGSGLANHATVTGATIVMRDVPALSQALAIAGSTSVEVPDTAALAIQQLTLAAWVQRVGTPATNQRYGVVDVNSRHAAIAIDDQGRAVCFVKDDSTLWFRPGGTTASGEWAFVACTYASPRLCTYVFRNGNATPSVTCGNTGGDLLDTSSRTGAAIGALRDSSGNISSRLSGNLDGVRIYARELSEAELCQSAGLTGC